MRIPSQLTAAAFTLVELMVATALLAVMLALIFGITKQAGDAWQGSAAKIESFQAARAAFESVTRRVSQATLQTYYDYFDSSGYRRTPANASTFVPAHYGRYSDLHFVSGKNLLPNTPRQIAHALFFQTPGGFTDDAAFRSLDSSLNAVGYYVEYSPDLGRPPFLDQLTPQPPTRNRYRLKQFIQPTQDLKVYTPNPANPLGWFTLPLASSGDASRQIAENIVALIVLPKRTEKDAAAIADPLKRQLAPVYEYDTRANPAASTFPQPVTENQLPPLVEVVLVAVDEPSFSHFGNPSNPPDLGQSQLFQDANLLEPDLREFENILSAKDNNPAGNRIKLRYQVFRTNVPIRAAKWSD